MGPRSTDRGNQTSSSAASEQLQASMGPRSTDRGNIPPTRGKYMSKHAPMGPRSTDRGNVINEVSRASSAMLQWGRDRLIAEIPLWRVSFLQEEKLQW